MALEQDVINATNQDLIMWCEKTVSNEQLFYSKIPHGHLVFIPTTNIVKFWSYKTDEIATVTVDLQQDITDNIQRHTGFAAETKNK